MIDILYEFVKQNISVNELIEAIISEEVHMITENIPQLLHKNKIDSTEEIEISKLKDTTKYNTINNTRFEPSINQTRQVYAASTPYNNFFRTNSLNTNTPNSHPLRINSTLAPLKNLSIKDALDCIPKFDGVNIPLSTFLFGIREAISMIPEANQSDLAKLIRRRLTGEAASAMEEIHFENIGDLIKFFEANFGSYKTHQALIGELASVKQKPEENIIKFANRVRRIAIELKEAAKRDKRDSQSFLENIEQDKLKFFTRGLDWEIRRRMGVASHFQEAVELAIEIEREVSCFDKNNPQNSKVKSENASVNIVQNANIEVCQFCDKKNHSAKNCWSLKKLILPSAQQPPTQLQRWAEPTGARRQTIPVSATALAAAPRNTPIMSKNQYSRNLSNTETQQSPNQSTKMCNYCKKEGHWKNECTILEKKKQVKFDAGNENSPVTPGASWEKSESERSKHTIPSLKQN